jgi:hypothetical protein
MINVDTTGVKLREEKRGVEKPGAVLLNILPVIVVQALTLMIIPFMLAILLAMLKRFCCPCMTRW